MEENLKQCPCCENHCTSDALQCGKGKRYFGNEKEQSELEHHHDHKHSHKHKEHYHDDVMKLDQNEQLYMLMRRCGHVLWHQNGGKESQKRILSILSDHKVMTQKELQKKLDVKSGSLSEILGKIEQDGLIERTVNEHDKRNIDVRLSEAGKQAVQKYYEDQIQERIKMFACLSKSEKERLLETLELLVNAWKEEGHHHNHKKDNRSSS